MAKNFTAEQVRERHVKCLNQIFEPPCGEVFNAIYNQAIELMLRWNEFCVLFASSAERVQELNETAGYFFYTVQSTLYDDVLLRIRRLTDREKSMGKDTLVLRRMVLLCPSDLRLEDLVKTAEAASDFAKEYRNKRLAHNDLDSILERSAKPMTKGSRTQVSNAVDAIYSVVQHVSKVHLDAPLSSRLIGPDGGAEALIASVERGVLAKKEYMEKLRGKIGR